MATYTDNLDGSSGALLSARSGWSRTVGIDDVTLHSSGSGYYMAGGAVAADGTWHKPTNQPAGNDQYAEAYILRGSAGNPFPLGVRCDPTSALGEGYLVGMDSTVRTRLFRRSAAGALTALGSYTHGNSTDQATNKQRLQVVGDQVSVTFMGTTIIGPVTDTNIASGSVAILTRGGTVSITTPTVDDLEWGDVSAASQSLTLPLLASTEALYAPTVTAGAVGVTLPLLASTAALYAPTVTQGAVSITLPQIASTNALYAPTVSPGAVSVTLPLIASTAALYAPTVVPDGGTQTLTLPLLASTSALYAPTVTPAAVSVTLPLLASGAVLYAPTVTQSVSVTLPMIVSTVALYVPTVTVSAANVELPLLSNVVAMFAPSITDTSDQLYPLAGLTQSYPLAGLAVS